MISNQRRVIEEYWAYLETSEKTNGIDTRNIRTPPRGLTNHRAIKGCRRAYNTLQWGKPWSRTHIHNWKRCTRYEYTPVDIEKIKRTQHPNHRHMKRLWNIKWGTELNQRIPENPRENCTKTHWTITTFRLNNLQTQDRPQILCSRNTDNNFTGEESTCQQ